jgi:hypothetical protein
MVWTGNRIHDHVDLVQQQRTTLCHVQPRADVEDDQPSIGIVCSRVLEDHAL